MTPFHDLKWTETDTDGSEVKLAYYLTKQNNQ